MSNFNIIDYFPNNCIYAFIDETNKEFYALHSSKALLELAKNITDLRDNTHSSEALLNRYKEGSLNIVVVKAFSDDVAPWSVRAEFGLAVSNLETQGYKNLRPDYKAGEFKLRAEILSFHYSPVPRFFVIAESKRKEKIVLGVFENIEEGKDWIKANFPDKKKIIPMFAETPLTKKYHEEYGYKLKED